MQVSLKFNKNNGYFTWKSIYICYHILLTSSFRQKCRENQITYFMFCNYFRKQCRLWDNAEKCYTAGQTTDDNRAWRMQIACSVPKVTNTCSEHVIILAFPLQQRLHECTSVFCHMYSPCLVWIKIQTLLILPIRQCKLCWIQNWQFTM